MGSRPPVVILCGGRGTRLRERTESVPKALVEIGGRPILWHVVQIYAAQGFERFLLATGYMGEAVAEFAAAERWPEGVRVECVDTGLDTPTGGRVARLGERVVVYLTGEGLKTLDATRDTFQMHEIDPSLDSFEAEFRQEVAV